MSVTSRKAVELLEDLVKSLWLPVYPKHEIESVLDETKKNAKMMTSVFRLWTEDVDDNASNLNTSVDSRSVNNTDNTSAETRSVTGSGTASSTKPGDNKNYDSKKGLAFPYRVWQEDLFRVKRCLLVYHSTRLRKIRETRWASGRMFADEHLTKMSAGEVEYLNDYNDIIDEYSQTLFPGTELDLGTDRKCWIDPYVTIRIISGNGEDELPTSDEKAIKLIPDKQYRVRTQDAEIFVQNNIAVIIPDEDQLLSFTPGALYGN